MTQCEATHQRVEAERFEVQCFPSMFAGLPVERDDNGYFVTVPTPGGPQRIGEGAWVIRQYR